MKDPIVGIDLGTSNSVVAHADTAGVVKVLADDNGYKIHPSVVSFHPNGGVIVGAAAKQRKVIDPSNTIYSVKRLIGRSFHSPEVQTARGRVPYPIKEGANGSPLIVTRGGEFAIPEMSAIILDHMRNIAAARLGTPVSRAVVTVPASFNDAQRSATATAGAIAGLTVVRVLNEPTAAALAYGNQRNLHSTIAVYDFGGGTFDITILRLQDHVFEVLGTSGDTFLGGDDLDERLVDKMVAKFLAENRMDLRTNEVAMMRLRAVAEQTKIELSRRSRAVVRIDEIAYGPKGVPLNLQIEITRDEFVSQVADIIDRTFPVCQEAMTLAGLEPDAISDVILVGGTTKIPYVRDQVSRFFGKAARTDVNPEDAVAIGAALQAASLEKVLARRQPSRPLPVQPSYTPPPDARAFHADSFSDEPALPTAGDSFTETDFRPADNSFTDEPAFREDSVTDARAFPDAADSFTSADTLTATPEAFTKEAPSFAKEASSFDKELGTLTEHTTEIAADPDAPPPVRPATLPAPPAYEPVAGRPKRHTKVPQEMLRPPAEPRPLTSYSVTRSGAKDTLEPEPNPFEPEPAAQPLARITRKRQPAPPPRETPGVTFRTPSTPPATVPASTTLPMQTVAPAVEPAQPPPAPTPPPAEPPLAAPSVPAVAPNAPTMIALAPAPPTAGSEPERPRPRMKTAQLGTLTFDLLPPSPQEFPIVQVPGDYGSPGPLILERTPRGLGIATISGFCEELIGRNSRVPTETKRTFTTSRDSQSIVRIVVVQGESKRIGENTVIGDLVLANLPPRSRGESSIEVTFLIDAAGVLQVRARDAQTGAEQRASLDLVGGLPHQELAASRSRIAQLRR